LIFHLDLDSFFVSAVRLKDPSLVGIPVAVGGSAGRGVLSSASYEARKFGIRSAMPVSQALRILPSLKIVCGDYTWFEELSQKVFEIVARFAPILEQVGIDEAYLDMQGTEALFGSPLEAAQKIRKIIFDETGLTASVGISSNRRVSKIASDFCKPNGVILIEAGKEREFLAPLTLNKIPGVGPQAEKILQAEGLFKIKDLDRWRDQDLVSRFGSMGEFLIEVKKGEGSKDFFEASKTRSSSRETTFHKDVGDPLEIKKTLWELATDLGSSLRAEKDPAVSYAHGIKLKLRTPDFKTISRQRACTQPTRLDKKIYDEAVSLFIEAWDSKTPIRLIGIGIILGDGNYQPGLFEASQAQDEKMDRMKDEMRKKFGKKAFLTGRDF